MWKGIDRIKTVKYLREREFSFPSEIPVNRTLLELGKPVSSKDGKGVFVHPRKPNLILAYALHQEQSRQLPL